MIEHKRKNEDDSRHLEIECDQYGNFRYQGHRWVHTDKNYLCLDMATVMLVTVWC